MNTSLLQDALKLYATPFYLFDEDQLRAQIAHLRSFFSPDTQLCYAMKANSFVLGPMAQEVERIEACSMGEVRSCLALGIPEEMLIVSGVYKDAPSIEELMAQHPNIGWYTAESRRQFELLSRTAEAHGRPIRLLLRLTSGNQFGMAPAEVEELALACESLPLVDFCGIHYYSGTQKTSLKRLKRELASIDTLCSKLAAAGVAVRELEFGPGFPVSYFEPQEQACRQQDELARGLRELLDDLTFTGSVTLELGRYLVANCGAYLTSVVDTKRNKTGNYAIVDGGKHQFVYYGNALSLQTPPCQLLPARDGGAPEPWNICGSLCTVNDILAKQLELADLKAGDAIAFERAGAYCPTEGIALFLSRDLPRIVLYGSREGFRKLRPRIETHTLNTPLNVENS